MRKLWIQQMRINNIYFKIRTRQIGGFFIALFYPSPCIVREKNLLKEEECICMHCLHKIPKTDCFKQAKNSVSKLFERLVLKNY